MAQKTNFFPIDDVYLSGLLRVKSGLGIRGPGVFRNGTLKLIWLANSGRPKVEQPLMDLLIKEKYSTW